MPTIKKYKDWSSWWDGLRTKAMEAAGTAVVTLLSTNGLDQMNIPGLDNIGMNWKTFVTQFLIHIAVAAGMYVKNKPTADVVEIREETTITVKKDL